MNYCLHFEVLVLVNSARELHGAAAVVVATWPLRGPFLQLAVKVAIAVD